MSDTITVNLGLIKPDVGGSDDMWGEKLNGNFDKIDTAIGPSIVSKSYVDAQDNLRVLKAGDTMSGALNLVGGGKWAFAAPGAGSWYSTNTTADRFFVGTDSSGDSFRFYAAGAGINALVVDGASGKAIVAGDPTTALGIATKQYADLKVAKAGDTMTGFLTLNADPSSPFHAATKQYVDSHAGSGGGSASISISDTSPALAAPGALWWESDTGILWMQYNDGTSTQFVEIGGGSGGSGATQAYVDSQDAFCLLYTSDAADD